MDHRPLLIVRTYDDQEHVKLRGYTEEVWTCNDGYRYLDRVDRLFDMHDYYFRRGQQGGHNSYIGDLPILKMPIFMIQHYPEIPASVSYPIDAVWRFFREKGIPLIREHWFASTPPYMLALALMEGYRDISLIGFERRSASAQANMAFWVGFAVGQGVTIHHPLKEASYAAEYEYGYQEAEHIKQTGQWDNGDPLEPLIKS